MQIEKYVHITKTPNGALVSFAGQVCLIIVGSPDSEMFFWRASPMFLKLTTGANAFSVPQSYMPHSSMAQAVADGLTKLDELGAFYGVIDMPEDTHGTVSEETEEAMLAESFVVRKTEKSRGVKSRIMISAAAVLGRATELAKAAGEKSGPKWVKMAHKEFSAIKAESEEFVQYEDAIVDGLASIKEDCRAEALSMSDSLLEAQQLAAELFEDISEEYLLNELSKKTLQSYNAKAKNQVTGSINKVNDTTVKRIKGMQTAQGKLKDKSYDKPASTNEEVEAIDETVNADHYNATSEPSQFGGGFRPKVVHKKKGTTMYLGQHGYKTKAAAAAGAKAYLDAYEKIGDIAASRAAHAHAKNHPDSLDEEVLDEKLDRHGDFHKSVENGIFAHSKYLDTTKKYLHDKDTRGGDGLSMKLATFDHEKHAQAAAKKHGGRVERTDFGTYRVTEEVLDEATRPLSGDAYWKSKEVESKEEYLKAQRKALGLPEPVKRGRGKPTNIDRDLLKSRAHSNVEAGKRPTAGFDRNEKIHFVRHLKDHPDFAEKHVSQAGRPVGTTKVAKQQQDLVKKKQDSAFSMWAGLGKK